MTKSRKRTQTGGSWTDWLSSGNATAAPPAPGTAEPSTSTDTEVTTPENGKKTWAQTFGLSGGSRRRRRCTKKHRHSSACKKLKARKSKGRKSYRKRR